MNRKSTIWQFICRKKLAFLLLLSLCLGIGANRAFAQTNRYVFYNASYGYIYNNNGSPGITGAGEFTFVPAAQWQASNTLNTSNDRSLQSVTNTSQYLRYTQLLTFPNGISIGNSQSAWRSNGYLYNRWGGTLVGNNYYVVYSDGFDMSTNTGSNRFAVYTVTTSSTPVDDKVTDPVISAAPNSTNTGIQMSHTNASGTYRRAYDTYVINSKNHYYYDDLDHSAAPAQYNVATGTTYTWSITSGGDYATIDQNGNLVSKGNNATAHSVTVTLTTLHEESTYSDVKTYTLSIQDIAEQITTASIGNEHVITQVGNSINLVCTFAGNYVPACTKYTINSTDHYLFNGHDYTTLPSINNGAGCNYEWRTQGPGISYSTINRYTGVLRYTKDPLVSDMSLDVYVTIRNNDFPGFQIEVGPYPVTLRTANIAAPTITRSGNYALLTIPVDGHTYYTIDGSDPTDSSNPNRHEYTGDAIAFTTSPITIKAYSTRDGHDSSIAEKTFEFQLSAPVITGDDGVITITNPSENPSGVTIYYTIDDGDPNTSSNVYTTPLNLDNAIVKAAIYKDGYIISPITTLRYSIQSGVYDNRVVLNDYEDHNWTYYAGVDESYDGGNYNTNYAGTMYSPDPRNVKIIYKGNGQLTDGTAVTGVKVGVDASANTFVYYKTIEKVNGAYKYTTIYNPFSVRPKIGSDYYGFSHWKVVNVTGGSISGNPTTINANTEITFVPTSDYTANCTSMTVELEAVWDVAEVITSGNFTNNYGVERMFFVITSSGNSNITANSKACTYTSFYPNGTTNGTTAATMNDRKYRRSGFSCNADSKFEYIYLNDNTTTMNANGYNLTVGRGVSNSNGTGACATQVVGMGAASNNNLNYTIRLESGVYSNFNMLMNVADDDNNSYTFGGVVTAKAIFGCDYDRATNTNTNLSVAPSGTVYGSNGRIFFSSANNKNNITYDWLIKSGTVLGSKSVADASADNCVYMGNSGDGNNADNVKYMGKRRLVMEGGQITSIAGGINATGNNYTTYQVSDGWALYIRIKGGTIRGSVYGAAAFAGAAGDRLFVMTGGTINGWVAGGANGTSNDGGVLNGSSSIYVGGRTSITSNGANTVINRSIGGNLYGAGCGYSGTSNSGQVSKGTNVVVADSAYVERGVYGGGSFGFIPDGTTDPQTSTIYITGGTVGGVNGGVNTQGTAYTANIHGGVFGGACQNKGCNATIYMNNGLVYGGIFGGSNNSGTLTGNVSITIDGGQVGSSVSVANVHGGGYGNNTTVNRNVAINIGKVKTTGATIFGDVYGGSALGKVNGSTATNTYSTAVTFNAGTLNGDLYGGALGNDTYAANVYGPVTVNVTGGTINGRVFGCNNINGAPQRTVVVTMTGGTVNQSVYGGGNTADYTYPTPGPVVTISGGHVKQNVFGAGLGEEASVSGNTNVTITGVTTIDKNVYGGGENGDVAGNTLVTISGKETELSVNDVYGAGYGLPSEVGGLTDVHINGGLVNGNVFGGGERGTARSFTTVTMTDGRVVGDIHAGAKGEGGDPILVYGLKTVNLLGGTVESNVYGGSRSVNDRSADNSDNAYSSFVNISGGTINRNVYGGGFYGGITGSIAVMIGKNVIDNHNTLASLNLKKVTPSTATNPLVIIGNVYAGSNWGTFSGGNFGASNISGRSDIFVDGQGYDMSYNGGYANNYMTINKSIYGAGTSTDAGKKGRLIIVKDYGLPTTESQTIGEETLDVLKSSTRSLRSIQRCDSLIIINSHIDFLGQGDMTSNITTEIYSIINVFDHLRMVNGSSVIMNYPVNNVKKIESDKTQNSIYDYANLKYSIINTNDHGALAIGGSTSGVPDNKFRINNGTYLNVRYYDDSKAGYLYGELSGFYHIVAPMDNTVSFAYARLKVTEKPDKAEQNPGDGGFLSYFSSINTMTDNGSEYTHGEQHPYTNQLAKSDTEQFRYWKFVAPQEENDTLISNREGVLIAQTDVSGKKYLTTDCIIPLSAACDKDSYYVISKLDWGVDVFACDTACTSLADNEYMDYHFIEGDQYGGFTYNIDGPDGSPSSFDHIRGIDRHPNLAFGLVAIPSGGLAGDMMVLSDNSMDLVQTKQFTVTNIEDRPELRLRLTYSNELELNNSLSPFFVTIDQYCRDEESGEMVLNDRTEAEVTITTATHIPQNLETDIYFLAYGDTIEPMTEYTRKITLPIFNLYEGNVYNIFKVTEIVDNTQGMLTQTGMPLSGDENVSMMFGAADNPDDQNGWLEAQHSVTDVKVAESTLPYVLGTADGRSMFSIDYTLFFDGTFEGDAPLAKKGDVTFTVEQYSQDGLTKLSTFDIKLNIVIRSKRTSWYLDGVNGQNIYSGHQPNTAKRTLGGIYNADYIPGDNIFVVNQTHISYSSEWSSRSFTSVKVRRYPGGHGLYHCEGSECEDYFEDYELEYGDNLKYSGPFLYIDGGTFTTKGMILDGSNDMTEGHGEPALPGGSKDLVEAEAPIAYLQTKEGDHPTLVLTNKSVIQNNTNNYTSGGAVYVSDGTECVVIGSSEIRDNIVSGTGHEGGGVYVECGGTLSVAQKVTITDNEAHGVDNNVFLESESCPDHAITVGYEVDEIPTGLSEGTLIGVTKPMPSGHLYTPVVYSTTQSYLPNSNKYFVDDEQLYDVIYNPEEPFDNHNAYFIGTWVSSVRTEPSGWSLNNIDSEEDLAWLISYVNGYNGCEPHPDASATLKADVDMRAHIWVPIGACDTVPFTGKFDGQAHTIDSLIAPFKITENLGMFGYVDGADIQGVFVTSCDFIGDPKYLGTVAGELHNSNLYNSEGAGKLKGGEHTTAIGGLVGLAAGSTIHSSMAMTTVEGDSHLGGLVGEVSSGSTVKNVFTNGIYKFTGSTAKNVGGLVGVNAGTIDNGYIRAQRTGSSLGTATFRSFTGDNTSVTHCYDASNNTYGYSVTSTPYLYKHNDNLIKNTPSRLVDTLNKQVSGTMASWMRSSANFINNDYPILKLPYNAVGSEDSIVLKYGTLTTMITRANAAANGGTIFQYEDEDIDETTMDDDVTLYIQEDAALLHNTANLKAYVGITLDNSSDGCVGNNGVTQTYDWHIISTSLQDAPLGVNYNNDHESYGYSQQGTDLPEYTFYDEDEQDGYFPSKEFGTGDDYYTHWDYYYYCEQYHHWINFKRNSESHWHENGNHANIPYENEETLVPGKGYLVAIDQPTFMQSHGKLNNGKITIPITRFGLYLKGCNMIGNPYQSYLDFNKFASENSGLWDDGAYYIIFDADAGGYQPYTVDSKGIGSSKGSMTARRYIHPHQGFYVIADNAGTATFKNEMRATTHEDASFREEEPEFPLINVCASDTLNRKEYAVVEFDRPVLGGCNKNEYLTEGNFHTYFHHESNDYSILFMEEPTDHVALFFEAMEEGTFTLTFSTANADFNYLHLIDNITGSDVNLLMQKSYTFNATPTDYKSRFKIVFSYSGTGIDEDIDSHDDFMFFNGSEWIVNGEGNLRLVDVTGRVLYTEELHSAHNVINMPQVAAGVYLVELQSKGMRNTQKIVIR